MNTKLYIAAFIIGADSGMQVYTKHHLGTFPASAGVDGTVPPGEPTVFANGNLNPLLDLDCHCAALAICADANRPSHAAEAAARGAATYLVGSFVIPSEFADATQNLQTRATTPNGRGVRKLRRKHRPVGNRRTILVLVGGR